MSKLLITPVLVAIEWFAYSKPASGRVLASIAVLLLGITLITLTDTQVSSNPLGMLVAAGAVLVTSLYQVRARGGAAGRAGRATGQLGSEAGAGGRACSRRCVEQRHRPHRCSTHPHMTSAPQVWAGTKQKELGVNTAHALTLHT